MTPRSIGMALLGVLGILIAGAAVFALVDFRLMITTDLEYTKLVIPAAVASIASMVALSVLSQRRGAKTSPRVDSSASKRSSQ